MTTPPSTATRNAAPIENLPPIAEAAPSAPTVSFLETWLDRTTHGRHANVQLLTERQGQRQAACTTLCTVVEDHLFGADVLTRMRFPRAARTFDERIPRGSRIRSGDLAEIIATEYVQSHTEFAVPLKRLRHKDDREMSMRGDDIIGLHRSGGSPAVLKAEVKSRALLTRNVVGEACTSLTEYRGRPKPQTLSFIAMQLRLTNRDSEAEQIERIQSTRLGSRDISHLVFTLSGNNPSQALAAHANERRLVADRRLVGLRVADHQQFIRTVFDSIRAGRLASQVTDRATISGEAEVPTAPPDDAAVD